ncbi:hypothetical protein [Streptomyces sp. NPDC054842]
MSQLQQADPHAGAFTVEDPPEGGGLGLELRSAFGLADDQACMAASTSTHSLGSALDIINEHEEHAPATPVTDGRE